MSSTYHTLIIGAGINGLCTGYHLSRQGIRDIGLIEQFGLAHGRGSSHGESRITRSAYVNAHYVRLMQIAHGESWPQLERDADTQLVYPTPGCFFGPPWGKYTSYAEAVTEVGVDVEPLTPEEGRKRFPVFRFENAAGVLYDRTAGLVAAAQTVQSLIHLIRRQDGEIRENTTVQSVDITRDPIRVATSAGNFETERLIVTAGPWVSRLLPVLKSRVAVSRQTVGYFQLEGSQEQFQPGAFPVWGYLLRKGDMSYYGLPQFGRDGIKLAKHIVSGVDDDPDDVPTQMPEDAVDDLRIFIKEQFVPPVERFLGWETCLYTNTATEDFILDIHPDNPNVVIGAGFSGHGFKFGPLTGRILSELSLNGKTTIPEFEAARDMFEVPLDDKAIKDLRLAEKDREQGNKDAYIDLDEL